MLVSPYNTSYTGPLPDPSFSVPLDSTGARLPTMPIKLTTAAQRANRPVITLAPEDLRRIAAHNVSAWDGFRDLLVARDLYPTTPREGQRVRVGAWIVYQIECVERARVRALWRVATVEGVPSIVPPDQGGRRLTDEECRLVMTYPDAQSGPVKQDADGNHLTGAGFYVDA